MIHRVAEHNRCPWRCAAALSAVLLAFSQALLAVPFSSTPPSATVEELLQRDMITALEAAGSVDAMRARGTAIPATRLDGRLGAEALADVDLWLGTNQLDRVLTAAALVLEQEPRSGLAYELTGTVNFLQGDDGKAIAALTKAVELEPEQPGPWAKLGTAYLRAGNIAAGRDSLLRAVELDPADRFSYQKLGFVAEQDGDIEAAIRFYRLGLEGMPPMALGVAPNLAALLNAVGRYDEAIATLQNRLPDALPNVKAHHILATAFLGAGRPDRAAFRYRVALSHKPDFLPSAVGLAVATRQRGQLDEAFKLVQRILDQQPDLAIALTERGRIWLATQRYDEALADFEQARSLGADPNMVVKLQSRAWLEKGDREVAEAALRALVDDGTANPGIYAMASEYRLAEKDFQGAENLLQTGVEKHPDSAYAIFRLGAFQAATRRYQEAVKTLEQALALAPGDPVILKALTLSHERIGNSEAALKFAETRYQLYPKSPETILELALLLEVNGQSTPAIARYQEVIRLQPTNALAHNNLANLLAAEGDLRAATRHARIAVDLAPHNGRVLDTLGWVQYLNKDFASAADTLSRAAELAPDSAAVFYHQARTFDALGKTAEAKTAAERALTLDQNASWANSARELLSR